MKASKTRYKKIALALSLCAIVLWGLLGAGASLAWFTDTSGEVKNIFNFADFDLEVSKRLDDGTYVAIDETTGVFDEAARYEPGYTQVAVLRVKNLGTVPFDFQTAVTVDGYTTATNAFGQTFSLQDHLRFGLVTAATEAELLQKVATRTEAAAFATEKLGNYYTDPEELLANGTVYMALIVYMPSGVGNEANYRSEDPPQVWLGVSVRATQKMN